MSTRNLRHDTWFRAVLRTWGVAIRIAASARIEPADLWLPGFEKVNDGVYLRVAAAGVPTSFIPFLRRGLARVADRISAAHPEKWIFVVVDELEYGNADFDERGLEPAIMKWASEVFGFEELTVSISFDEVEGRYVFDFEE